ncbi:MAG: hypothetical protein LW817_02520 [Candidatus Caenarcaniphilales bacterium]|jgi:hypothetical protein|nr:hypothetical protein [Candidatus Caenarcaniphilales bacterium]
MAIKNPTFFGSDDNYETYIPKSRSLKNNNASMKPVPHVRRVQRDSFLKEISQECQLFLAQFDKIRNDSKINPLVKIKKYIEISVSASTNNRERQSFLGNFPPLLVNFERALSELAKTNKESLSQGIELVQNFVNDYLNHCINFKNDPNSNRILARNLVPLFRFFEPTDEQLKFVTYNHCSSSNSHYLRGLISTDLNESQIDKLMHSFPVNPDVMDFIQLFDFAFHQKNSPSVRSKLTETKEAFKELYDAANIEDKVKLLQYHLRALIGYPDLASKRPIVSLFKKLEKAINDTVSNVRIPRNFVHANVSTLIQVKPILHSNCCLNIAKKLIDLSTQS